MCLLNMNELRQAGWGKISQDQVNPNFLNFMDFTICKSGIRNDHTLK